MRNPIQLTKSGAGVVASPLSISPHASLAQIVGVADGTVALDVDVYIVQSATAPSSITGATFIGKIRAPVNTTFVLPLIGNSGGIQISSPNVWVVVNFNDAGTGHQVVVYQDQE